MQQLLGPLIEGLMLGLEASQGQGGLGGFGGSPFGSPFGSMGLGGSPFGGLGSGAFAMAGSPFGGLQGLF
ncbi:MAG: hypothetical protein ACYCW6_32625 [Candidatus Xenobia bacterium]